MRRIIVEYENDAAIHLRIEGTLIRLTVEKPTRQGNRLKPALIGGTYGLQVPDVPSAREIIRLFAEAVRLAEEYNRAAGIDGDHLRYTRSEVNRWTV